MKGSGRYNTKIRLQRVSTAATTDIAGEIDLTNDSSWTTFAIRSAYLKPAKGSEFWNVDQVDHNGILECGMQYDSLTKSLTPAMRLLHGTRKLNIVSVFNVDEVNREVTLHVMEPK